MNTPSRAPAPLRIGILGCANIARQFARDVAASPEVQVVAVASRRADTAAAFAQALQIGRYHASYEALLADDQVDAIYLPLPNSLHAEWAVRALAAGKHVLCEKPLALGRAQVQAMFKAAHRHQRMLLEAYPYWFQPQTGDLIRLLGEGAIGTVRGMQASFGFMLAQPQGNIRMQPALGGGALLDAGSYPMSLIRLVMGCAPQKVLAQSTWADTGVDTSTSATLVFADGRRAQLSCAMDVATHRRAILMGTQGIIETEYLNHTSDGLQPHPWGYQPSQMRLRQGVANTQPLQTVLSPTGSGFRFAAEAFARVVADQDWAALARAEAASLDIATTLEALGRSARSGRWVTLPGG
jgi:predicted dehydrogenase